VLSVTSLNSTTTAVNAIFICLLQPITVIGKFAKEYVE
jgi:hypothetical protein